MRIIAGTLKGRRLAAGTWPGLRPTSDRVRETLFNIVAPRVVGARVLDGYAGSGANGLEALSRGAQHVTFLERDGRACRLIASNVERCGVQEACAIIRADVEHLAPSTLRRESFDLVLLDPPYAASNLHAILEVTAPYLAKEGLLVLEHAYRRPATEVTSVLVRARQVRSGDTALAFYERRDCRA